VLRRLLRGRLPRERLEAVADAVAERRGCGGNVEVEVIDADNWLSTPCVVDGRWFVKVTTPQNALVHAVLTAGRNLGAVSAGAEGFFETFDNPVEMAEHELAATRRMRALGVNVPEPVEAFEHDGLGVLVLEYIPDFRSLDDLDTPEVAGVAPDLFASLSRMAAERLVHGDLRAENVLLADGEVYFIDATNVSDDEDALPTARSYDLACALAVLAPRIGARPAVAAAAAHYSPADLLDAREFLDFVRVRPDHDFDAASVKAEIEKTASRAE
jgi:hypothetical protein